MESIWHLPWFVQLTKHPDKSEGYVEINNTIWFNWLGVRAFKFPRILNKAATANKISLF